MHEAKFELKIHKCSKILPADYDAVTESRGE